MVAVKKDKISGDALGTGRKSSVARVRVRPGNGTITINKKPIAEYFVNDQHQAAIVATLSAVEKADQVDVLVRVSGGGMTGQSGAVRMGLARALVSMDETLHETLREGGFLTRDSRMKERKKPGLRGARRGVQFSKRYSFAFFDRLGDMPKSDGCRGHQRAAPWGSMTKLSHPGGGLRTFCSSLNLWLRPDDSRGGRYQFHSLEHRYN